jgi:hypothetical protein
MGHWEWVTKKSCKNGTQLAYQHPAMRSLIRLAALAGFAVGARHFFKFLKEHEKNRIQQKRLEIWEGEGGAVPVAANKTAAQVRPQKPSSASSRGVG